MPLFGPQGQILSAVEVNELHRNDDVDRGVLAHHHTLGNRANQAAPGNHNHYRGFQVYHSTNQTIPNNSETTLVYDTETFDTDNAMDISTGIFTAPVDGVWLFTATGEFDFNTTGVRQIKLYISTIGLIVWDVQAANINGAGVTNVSIGHFMAKSDTAYLATYQDSGANRDIFSFFSGSLLGIL